MGLFAQWFFGKPIKQLEDMKERRIKKIENLKVEIAEIDKEIVRQSVQ